MTDEKKPEETKPEPMPQEGGSYRRNPDGSLVRVVETESKE